MTQWPYSQNREAEFAGKFYPASRTELQRELKKLFEKAKRPRIKQIPQALIAPHAGYVFSGLVAASAYNQIPAETEYKRVFILASSHQMRFKGASVFTSGNYSTPLGIVDVDTKLGKELAKKSSCITEKEEAHFFEHSLEVQLPFLQEKLGRNFLLVPLILGTNSAEECREIATTLQPWFNSSNLFIVSTDLSHYPTYEDAVFADERTTDAVVSGDPQKLLDALEANRKLNIPGLSTSMCGWTSTLTLMYLAKENGFEFCKIHYMNSGDNRRYGEKDRVVGYQAIGVFPETKAVFSISEKEKNTLLEIARRSLFDSYGIKKYTDDDLDKSGILQEKLGAFVSLYLDRDLKGCIGRFQSDRPLADIVRKMAVSASNDRRFKKPEPDDINWLTIEISVLSPMKLIKSVDEIELGRHGVYIKKGFMSGTFLPQVADKTGWNLEEFLGHCSKDKAGLGWEGWKNAEIYIYEAEVFKG